VSSNIDTPEENDQSHAAHCCSTEVSRRSGSRPRRGVRALVTRPPNLGGRGGLACFPPVVSAAWRPRRLYLLAHGILPVNRVAKCECTERRGLAGLFRSRASSDIGCDVRRWTLTNRLTRRPSISE
jgi:hypothetical protein